MNGGKKMKLKKILGILTILAIVLLFFNHSCFAKVDPDLYKPKELTSSDYEEAFKLGGTIVSGLTMVGTIVAIVGIMVLGIKYMIGSTAEKAEYKKTMIPYLIGCIFIFAISRIVSIIYSLASQI